MKRIIDDKLYDTDTATLIYKNDLLRHKRMYYQTEKGTFFCHYVSSEKIELVDEKTMKEILAEKDPDKYIKIFGKVVEG